MPAGISGIQRRTEQARLDPLTSQHASVPPKLFHMEPIKKSGSERTDSLPKPQSNSSKGHLTCCRHSLVHWSLWSASPMSLLFRTGQAL